MLKLYNNIVLGGFYWAAMLPIDAVKSRQQVLSIGSKDSISFFDCARGLHQAAGIRGFYAGLGKFFFKIL